MTDNLDRLRAALEAGPTPGPWYWEPGGSILTTRIGSEGHRRGVGDFAFATIHDPTPVDEYDIADQAPAETDAAYIAAADPSTIRELLAERDALAAVAASYRDSHQPDCTCERCRAYDRAVSRP